MLKMATNQNGDSLYKRKRTFLCKHISSSVLCRLFASITAADVTNVVNCSLFDFVIMCEPM